MLPSHLYSLSPKGLHTPKIEFITKRSAQDIAQIKRNTEMLRLRHICVCLIDHLFNSFCGMQCSEYLKRTKLSLLSWYDWGLFVSLYFSFVSFRPKETSLVTPLGMLSVPIATMTHLLETASDLCYTVFVRKYCCSDHVTHRWNRAFKIRLFSIFDHIAYIIIICVCYVVGCV